MTTQQIENDIESYLERRYERAIDRLDREYLMGQMSSQEYREKIEILKVEIFQGTNFS